MKEVGGEVQEPDELGLVVPYAIEASDSQEPVNVQTMKQVDGGLVAHTTHSATVLYLL